MNPCLFAPAAALTLSLAAQAAPRPTVDADCVVHGMGPQLECTVRVTRDGRAVDGLAVRLGASMPSMPMAHSVRPVAAVPTGQPGTYRGTLALEMNGAWALQIDLAGPLRDRVVLTVPVDDCEGDRRCPVPTVCSSKPAAAGAAHRH